MPNAAHAARSSLRHAPLPTHAGARAVTAAATVPNITVSSARQAGSTGGASWAVTNVGTPASLAFTLNGPSEAVAYTTVFSITTGTVSGLGW